jgi:hypothetical protein
MKSLPTLILALFLTGCNLAGDSTNTILKEIPNQNQSKKVILFFKEGGATVGNSYQLTISDIGYNLKESEAGNVFTVDDNHGNTNLDSSSIFLSWITNDSLRVTYNQNLRTFIQEAKVNGVNVIYSPR